MNKFLLFSCLLFCLSGPLSAQGLEWAIGMGGTGYDETCYDIIVDPAGNVYTTGSFSERMDFDPGPAELNIQPAHGDDLFIQKLDPNGKLLWLKHIGGSSGEYGRALDLDAEGNLYVTGAFAGTADFDPGFGVFNLVGSANSTIFILKLDANGDFAWAKEISSSGSNTAFDVKADNKGHIYITGRYSATPDFNPDLGTFTLTSEGNSDIYLLKLDTEGKFVWVKGIGAEVDDEGNALAIAENGDVYLAGSFNRWVDFDPNPGETIILSTGGNEEDIFIEKFDPDGNMIWVRTFGSYERDLNPSMTLDASGNILTTGVIYLPTDLDPGPDTVTLELNLFAEQYVQKLSPDGNFIWAQTLPATHFGTGPGIVTDAERNIYLLTSLTGTTDFDPGPTKAVLTTNGMADVVILKLDSTGKFIWADHYGSAESDHGNCLTLDASGQIYTAGVFELTADMDPGPGVSNLISNGSYDIYVQKMGQNWNFHGTVYQDLNNNLVQDAGENGIPGIVLYTGNAGEYVSTDSVGQYRIYNNISGLPLQPFMPQPYYTVTPDFAIPDSSQAAMDFAVNFDSAVRDLGIELVQVTPFRRGFQTELWVFMKNYGSTSLDSITLRLDIATDQFTFVSAEPVPDLVAGDSLVWSIDSLGPFESIAFRVFYSTPFNLPNGSIVSVAAFASLANDVYLYNNTSALRVPVLGSYDPNDKQVFPEQLAPVELDSSRLRYLIRFQNTGNLPADFVVIRDTLPAGLDVTTLQMLGASHPYTSRIYGGGILEVRFDPINLPDSISNEPASHGFVAFSTKANPNLSLGDSVANRAGIYFDYNEPVITNSAVMHVTKVSGVSDLVNEFAALELYPNPAGAGNSITLKLKSGNDPEPGLIEMYDIKGALLRRIKTNNSKLAKLELSGVPAGVYLVRLITDHGLGSKLLLVR